jgi:hypothetical protein
MTLFYPDVSNNNGRLTLAAGTVAVSAKATESTDYTDPDYAWYRAEAARVGAIFVPYHFLHAGNGAAQADFHHSVVGSVGIMLDVEPTGDSSPTVADVAAFKARFEALGGRVVLNYFPQWHWEQVGGDLGALNIPLVASSYGAYSDSSAAWDGYGGGVAAVWQYTDAFEYAGGSVDFNAYRGTVSQFALLVNDSTSLAAASPTPAPVAAPADTLAIQDGDDEMQQIDSLARNPEGQYAYGVGALGPYGSITFGYDGFGSVAQLRVVAWGASGLTVTQVEVGSATLPTGHKTVVPLPVDEGIYLVTVTRQDSNAGPVAVAIP